MKIVLLQDVEKLGKVGDVVSVRDGYGRNFLIPRKLAAHFAEKALKELEAKKKKREKAEEKIKVEAQVLAERIEKLSLTVSMEAGVEDKLFGAITPEKITAALNQEGLHIDKKNITIEEPIKKLGIYQIAVKLHPEVKATLRVWVVKK